jgi:dCMP deaminase
MKSWDEFYLELAEKIAERSKDPSTKVGAVIVRPNKTIVSLGFNGFPRGMEDKEEWLTNRDEKYSRVIHGEINALLNSKEDCTGYTIYLWPFLSCDRCTVQIIQSGIKRVVTRQASEEQLTRWGPAFEKSLKYYWECGVKVCQL